MEYDYLPGGTPLDPKEIEGLKIVDLLQMNGYQTSTENVY